MEIQIKRVYEQPKKSDGFRILVDRVWPRGMTKEKASVDLWLKEIGPSNELRKWFGHDPVRWEEFRKRYFAELKKNKEVVTQLKEHLKNVVTLVYSAKDEEHNQAVVIREFLNNE